MNPIVPIRRLVAEVLAELERLNYAENTRNTYRRFYNRLIAFADSIGETVYSEDLGNKYLRMHHHFDLDSYKNSSHRTFRGQARCIRVLGDYQLHGAILRRRTTKAPYERTPQFAEALKSYQKECVRRNYSEQGMRTQIYRAQLFIDYLDDCGMTSLSLLTTQHLSGYIRTIAGYHKKSISAILTTLRSFLRFLYLNCYHEKDLSSDVPKLKQPHFPKIPSAWKPEDVKRVLESVDRGNPNGKRDYAILLMVARLGMRIQDIKEIRLTNLNWATRSMEIVQHKTKQTVSYPILDDIGWAIIDYLKNGRPRTESPHLFVRHHAPFEAFGTHANLHNMITKYTRLAGIKLRTGASQGMHSLRHTLASVLLEQETPLPVISEILGHMSTMSTSVYLKIDLEGLRKCALDPADAIQGFVLENQALGYAYQKQAAALKRFDEFCVEIGHSQCCLSKELAMQWAEKKLFESDDAHSRRIRLVRILGRYLVRLGYDAYIYPDYLGRSRSQQYQPYLFTETELARFFNQVDQCQPVANSPYRHLIFPLLFRILYGCGLRVSEVLHLTVGDVNTIHGILTIRNAKFHKDRLVTMAPSLNERCRIYMEVMHPTKQPEYIFFPSPPGGQYCEKRIYEYFRRFLWQAGISHGGRGKGPRLHDLRHTFAVHCLKRWVRSGADLTVALPYLSTYLGHKGLKSSQHYLHLTAELYPDIVATMDERFGCLLPGDDQ